MESRPPVPSTAASAPVAPRIVGARVDALRLAYGIRVDPAWLSRLQSARSLRAVVTLAGVRFAVDPHGMGCKPFALEGSIGRVLIGEREAIVDFGVPMLAMHGVADLVARAESYARSLAPIGAAVERAEVRELDLAADLAGAAFGNEPARAFVGRIRMNRTENSNGAAWYSGGRRTALYVTLYNKTAQLREIYGDQSDRATMERQRWAAAGWDGRSDVWRLEIRPRGHDLRSFGLREPATLAAQIDPMWQRCTRETLRLVDPSTATRPERCRTDPRWGAYREAVFVDPNAAPAVRMPPTGQGLTLKQAIGAMLSAHALAGTSKEAVESWLRSMPMPPGQTCAFDRLSEKIEAVWTRKARPAGADVEAARSAG